MPITNQTTGNISANPSAVNPAISTPSAQSYIQSQLSDKQAQLSALQSNHFTDTNQLQQNSQGQYVPSDYETAKAGYTKAYQDYINTLNPSSDVTNAQNAYNDYTANQSKSVAGLAGKDAGVPLSIVRGQQAQLLAQTQPEAQRLQNQIGINQSAQTAKTNAGLANVSLQEKLLGAQQSPAQQAASSLATQKTKADLANTQATTQKTLNDINSPVAALDVQNKQLQNQKLQQEIANPKGANSTYTPDQLSNITDTTNSGIPFIGAQDLADFKTISDSLPPNSTVKVLSPTNTALVGNIDQARDNLSSIQDTLTGLLATSGTDPKRISNMVIAKTDIGKNADKLSAFNNFGIAGLQIVKTILKIPGARISGFNTDPTSYIPSVNDTVGKAKEKVDNLNKLLDNTEKSIFGNKYYKSQKGSQASQYTPGQVITNGNLNLTVSADGKSFTGSDGHTYDLQGNLTK